TRSSRSAPASTRRCRPRGRSVSGRAALAPAGGTAASGAGRGGGGRAAPPGGGGGGGGGGTAPAPRAPAAGRGGVRARRGGVGGVVEVEVEGLLDVGPQEDVADRGGRGPVGRLVGVGAEERPGAVGGRGLGAAGGRQQPGGQEGEGDGGGGAAAQGQPWVDGGQPLGGHQPVFSPRDRGPRRRARAR